MDGRDVKSRFSVSATQSPSRVPAAESSAAPGIGRSYARDVLSRFVPGRYALPLVGALILFSCSRQFGFPNLSGIPQATFARICFGLLFFMTAVTWAEQNTRLRPFRRSELSLWTVTGVAAVSGVVAGSFVGPDPATGYYKYYLLMNLFLLPALLYSILLRTTSSSSGLDVAFGILTVFALYLGITAVLETLELNSLLFPSVIADPSVGLHRGRARGPFLQAEFNGAVMGQLLPVTLLAAWRSRTRLAEVVAWAASALLLLGIYLTYTRAAMLGVAGVIGAGAIFASPLRDTYRGLLFIGLAGVGLVGVAGGEAIPRLDHVDSLVSRVQLAGVAVNMIVENPLTGVGFGQFNALQTEYLNSGILDLVSRTEFWAGGSHNTFLTLLAELGVLVGGGFVLLVIWVMTRPFIDLWRAGSSSGERELSDDRKALILTAGLVAVAYFINGSAVEIRYTLTPTALFWLFAAIYVHAGPGGDAETFASR